MAVVLLIRPTKPDFRHFFNNPGKPSSICKNTFTITPSSIGQTHTYRRGYSSDQEILSSAIAIGFYSITRMENWDDRHGCWEHSGLDIGLHGKSLNGGLECRK
jgi:hypothetical protein